MRKASWRGQGLTADDTAGWQQRRPEPGAPSHPEPCTPLHASPCPLRFFPSPKAAGTCRAGQYCGSARAWVSWGTCLCPTLSPLCHAVPSVPRCPQPRLKWSRPCSGHRRRKVTIPVDAAMGGPPAILVHNPSGWSWEGNVLEIEVGLGQAWNQHSKQPFSTQRNKERGGRKGAGGGGGWGGEASSRFPLPMTGSWWKDGRG